MNYDYLFKVIIIGDSGVGKSCILLRFADNTFNNSYVNTIGVDFKIRTVNVDSKTIKLQMWDTAGQDRFRTLTCNYYRGAHGILIVYDITDRETFDDVKKWMDEVNEFTNPANPTNKPYVILIGNKCDKNNNREVSYEEGSEYATKNNMLFLETSAKETTNIERAFTLLAKSIKDNYYLDLDGDRDTERAPPSVIRLSINQADIGPQTQTQTQTQAGSALNQYCYC